MNLFHGSNCIVKNPVTIKGRHNTDFGKGFYTTTNFEQSRKWALYKLKSKEDTKAVVTTYEVPDDILKKTAYNIKIFSAPDKAWLSFIVDCRRGIMHDYDIVMGPVANDRIYATITLYESGVLSAEATVAQLKVNEYFNQISFHSVLALKEVKFVESVEVFVD